MLNLSNRGKEKIPNLSGFFFLFIGFFLLRVQIAQDLHLGWKHLYMQGLQVGILHDFSILLLVMSFGSLFFFVSGIRRRWLIVPLVLLVFIAALCNVLYFRFFGTPLEAWIVAHHFGDVGSVSGASFHLMSLLLFGATGCIGVGIGKLWKKAKFLSRGLHGLIGVVGVVLALLVKQSPVWFHWMRAEEPGGPFRSTVLGEQVIYAWYDQVQKDFFGQDKYAITNTQVEAGVKVLTRYRDLGLKQPLTSVPTLSRTLTGNPAQSRHLRQELGLPLDEPIHIVVLLLESFRAFEAYHPRLAPQVVPFLHRMVQTRAWSFSQVYSSSLDSGQTVRGNWSTYCSQIPNIQRPSVYIGFTHTRVTCLQEALQKNHYTTLSFQPFHRNFHNSQAFEAVHGVEQGYALEDLNARGVTQDLSGWGIADKPLFQEILKIMDEQWAEKHLPIFVQVNTSVTHYIPPYIADNHLPENIKREMKDSPEYLNFLSAMNYTDQAVESFAQQLFSSPRGGSTLLVVAADHSIPKYTPPFPMSRVQVKEAAVRIPLLLLTKNLSAPRKFTQPFHQVDIGPGLAQIAGISSNVEWIGSGLFSEAGRPWVSIPEKKTAVDYRVQDRACYQLDGESQLRCYKILPGQDPLFADALQEIPEDSMESEFFKQVVLANRLVIQSNRFRWSPEASLKSE